MGFRLSTFGVITALLVAFVQAPCSHVHEHESTQHHVGSSLFHTHFAHVRVHHSGQAELTGLDPDDDAVFQQWFSATEIAPQELTIILHVVPVLSPPVAREWRAEAVQPNAHDPPSVSILPPRSPPV